jgi:xylulokinase
VDLLLGLDIGTSGVKAVACNTRGRIVTSATAAHAPRRPHPGWSEQDPEEWWRSVIRSVRAVLRLVRPQDIVAIGLSGQMHGSVLLGKSAEDSEGLARALRPALLWNDQRTAAQCAAIESAVGGRASLVELVGNAALTGFTLPKLLWVREHEPRIWARVHHFALPKDFIQLRLTGKLSTDVGDASGTLLFDIDKRAWSSRMFAAMHLDRSLAPPVLESTDICAFTSRRAARQTGLPEGIPVVAGSGDNMAGAVGAGVVEPGMAMAMLGTSGVILAHSLKPRKDLPARKERGVSPAPPGRLHAMCAATGAQDSPEGWCNTGVMLSAAGSLAWCRDTIAPGESFDALLHEAAKAPPGCDGLVFLPYLTGERCPHPDPTARGAWIGLTSRHTRAHLVRAVIEGVTFGMADILDLMRQIGVDISHVRLSGGGNRSALWRQVQADLYGCPISTTSTEEGGSSLGAAIMAGVGIGVWSSVAKACRAVVRPRQTIRPARNAAGRYAPAREVYSRLYHDLRERFAALSAERAAARAAARR